MSARKQLEATAQAINHAREFARECGHNVARITIGIAPAGDLLRVCDDSGAYDFHYRADGRLVRACVGLPSRALETIANDQRIGAL